MGESTGVVTQPTDPNVLDTGGQGSGAGGTDTTAGDNEALESLKAQLAEREALLEEQRKVQSGLDRRVSQLQEQLKLAEQEKQDLTKQLDELRSAASGASEELEQYKARVPELESKLGEMEAQLQQHSSAAEQARIVATEFPMLAPLLETGGLPQFTEADEFREKLDKIVSALNLAGQQQFQRQAAGAHPPASPPAQPTLNSNQILADMLKASEEQDWDRYNQLAEQWRQVASKG